jgi:hypothetical protein
VTAGVAATRCSTVTKQRPLPCGLRRLGAMIVNHSAGAACPALRPTPDGRRPARVDAGSRWANHQLGGHRLVTWPTTGPMDADGCREDGSTGSTPPSGLTSARYVRADRSEPGSLRGPLPRPTDADTSSTMGPGGRRADRVGCRATGSSSAESPRPRSRRTADAVWDQNAGGVLSRQLLSSRRWLRLAVELQPPPATSLV